MSESDIKAIALFFFFTTLDENVAVLCSSDAYEHARKKIEKDKNLNPAVVVTISCIYSWKKNRKKIFRGRPQYTPDSGWLIPNNLNMGSWTEFQKFAPEDELIAIVLSKILCIDDEAVSIALGITQGTIRFRVGRALKRLSQYLNQNSNPLSLVGKNV
jgi:hypothetical protein